MLLKLGATFFLGRFLPGLVLLNLMAFLGDGHLKQVGHFLEYLEVFALGCLDNHAIP
jgi:hypothetical protein